jgi:hypothetical protein
VQAAHDPLPEVPTRFSNFVGSLGLVRRKLITCFLLSDGYPVEQVLSLGWIKRRLSLSAQMSGKTFQNI